MEAVQNVLSKIGLGNDKAGASAREPTPQELKELKEKYTKAKQEQVFAFYDGLSGPEQASLYEQLAGFEPEHINTITDRVSPYHSIECPAICCMVFTMVVFVQYARALWGLEVQTQYI